MLGKPVKRVEDPKFITGKGRYLDDVKLPGMAHLAILRSPYAHANIRSIDTSAAKAAPGVVAVIVGSEIPWNPLPMAWPAGGASGIQNNVNMPRILATDDVKWINQCVGDNKDEGQTQQVVLSYCTCMNNEMDNNETRSVSTWEKTAEGKVAMAEAPHGVPFSSAVSPKVVSAPPADEVPLSSRYLLG